MRYDTFTMRLFSLLFLIALCRYLCCRPSCIRVRSHWSRSLTSSSIFGISYFSAIAIICIGTGIIGMCYAVFGGLKAVAVFRYHQRCRPHHRRLCHPDPRHHCPRQAGWRRLYRRSKALHLRNCRRKDERMIRRRMRCRRKYRGRCCSLGMFVNNLFYWATNQSIIQRSLGGKNLAESQKGAIWAGFFKCLDVFVIVLPGIIAFQLLAANGQMDTSVGMAADQAYPLLVMEVLPKPLMGFFAAVMFGAILSSFNSVLNSASTIFTLNVWQPIWGKQASNSKVVKVGQIFGTAVGVVSIAIAPFVMFFGTGIMNFINECWGFFSMPLLTAVLFGLLSKKAPAIAPKIVIPAAHRCCTVVTKVIPFFSRFHYLYVVFALFVLECIIYAICIKVSPRVSLRGRCRMPRSWI